MRAHTKGVFHKEMKHTTIIKSEPQEAIDARKFTITTTQTVLVRPGDVNDFFERIKKRTDKIILDDNIIWAKK